MLPRLRLSLGSTRFEQRPAPPERSAHLRRLGVTNLEPRHIRCRATRPNPCALGLGEETCTTKTPGAAAIAPEDQESYSVGSENDEPPSLHLVVQRDKDRHWRRGFIDPSHRFSRTNASRSPPDTASWPHFARHPCPDGRLLRADHEPTPGYWRRTGLSKARASAPIIFHTSPRRRMWHSCPRRPLDAGPRACASDSLVNSTHRPPRPTSSAGSKSPFGEQVELDFVFRTSVALRDSVRP